MFFKLQIISKLIDLRLKKWRFRNSLSKLQMKRWRKLNNSLLKSPYYREAARKKLELAEYPLVNKSVFMAHFDEINTHGITKEHALKVATEAEITRDFSPMINGVTVGLSSGTSGNRGVFMATEEERASWVSVVLDRVIGFSLKHRKVAFFLRANSNLYNAVRSRILQFEFFDLLQPLHSQLNRLNILQPDILVAQPSLLLELAITKQEGKVSISPIKIISVAEVLYPEDKEFLEQVFGQKIHQVYQCTEGLLASTCKEGVLHFHEDYLIIEKKYLDDEKVRFHPVITDLMRTTQPVIRYELNDIIHERTSCECGSPMLAIDRIEGRSDDILSFVNTDNEEVKIYPDFFRRAIILANEHISDYALLQTSLYELALFVDGDDQMVMHAEKALRALLSEYKIGSVKINVLENKPHEKGHKLRRIRNDIK